MIKKWATVVSYQNKIALVKCDIETLCGNCTSSERYCNHAKNNIKLQHDHIISVYNEQILVKGQKVELGFDEKNFLWSTMLIYLFPLGGLFMVASLFELLFGRTDFSVICGSALGGTSGFLLARIFSRKLIRRKNWKPIILSIETSDKLRIEMLSSKVKQPSQFYFLFK